MTELLYKKKSLRFSGCGISKAVRVQEHSEVRKSSRLELLNIRRNIGNYDDSLISAPEPQKETSSTGEDIPKPSRLEQLKKWKEEKALKKKIENEKKKTPFVVGIVKAKPEAGYLGMNSTILLCSKITSRTVSKNTSVLNAPRNISRVIPKVNLPATSGIKGVTKNVKTDIQKSFVSRIPSRNVPQVNPKTSGSRIPTCKPILQQKKVMKENRPAALGIVDTKENRPAPIGKIDPKKNRPPIFGFKNSNRVCESQFYKAVPGGLKSPNVIKNKVKKPAGHCNAAPGKKLEKKTDVMEQKASQGKRQSFAPENFKFVPALPMLDLSAFEGLDFSGKTKDLRFRASTPVKQTPVPSPVNENCIDSRVESENPARDDECVDAVPSPANENCIGIGIKSEGLMVESECADEKENTNINTLTEVRTIENVGTAGIPDATMTDEELAVVNVVANISEEISEAEQYEVGINKSEKNKCSNTNEKEDEVKKEVVEKNVTRRNRKQKRNSKAPELESVPDVNLPESLCNQRLFSIKEELENTVVEAFATLKANALGVRRSLRLLSKNDSSVLTDSPRSVSKTPKKVESPASSVQQTVLSEAFSQLQMNSTMLSEEELIPQLPVKEMKSKKVSLLYTPPNSRYSLRKSIRGDLISFS